MTFLLGRDLVCRVAGVEQPVPHRQEEAAVVGSVHRAPAQRINISQRVKFISFPI